MKIPKDIVYTNWKGALLILLTFLLFKTCQNNQSLQVANNTHVKELVGKSEQLVSQNRILKNKISVLQNQKQKVKTEIVYIENKTKSDIKKVTSLNTKQIANYYKERYKFPVTITQYGVSLSDTIAKRNITELIQKDGCFAEIKLVRSELSIEENKGFLKDTIIGNLDKSNLLLNDAILEQEKIIKSTEKSLKSESRKKKFWQLVSGAAFIGGGYLLISQ